MSKDCPCGIPRRECEYHSNDDLPRPKVRKPHRAANPKRGALKWNPATGYEQEN